MKFETPYTVAYDARDPATGVDALFYQRWSPRSFKKTELPENVLQAVFDAARWAPSCYNDQPWLLITSSGAADFDLFCKLLLEANQAWARNASVIGFIAARKNFEHNGKPNRSAQFDCGAAWMAMTLQARRLGLYTHGMGGIKREEVYTALNIDPTRYEVICGFALGVIDVPTALPEDIAAGEKPSGRKSLPEIWRRGKLG